MKLTVPADSPRNSLAQSLVVGLEGPRATPAELELVAKEGLGGVIHFRRNLGSPREVWELNDSLHRAARAAGRPPLFVMVDQEGGSVVRLKAPFTEGPDLRDLGRSGDARLLRQHGVRVGAELVAAGFNWNLAPVMDVHAVEGGIMARRSLGSDPILVGELGVAYLQGLQATGCLGCAKHFPGLGRTTLDTHRERPRVELSAADLQAVELVPFRRAAQAGAAGIMVCHAVFTALDPQRPASLSPLVAGDLLRRDLGYEGLVLSDDLEMGAVAADLDPAEAAVRAYLAGCDLLLICHQAGYALEALDRLTALAEQGEISLERIQATASRLARAKGALPPPPADTRSLKKILAIA